ncbi:MAG TPA: Cys-tRNA(Pro) deacylase [Clostridiales bacterium]|jgi:Cys-tRNA(Pro)/Cys-tRNA(Cys) deacylase|nr:Cys-tRNA(Pro) deacylase [Clostridiales bacterium]
MHRTKSKSNEKTNVMRILDTQKISYQSHCYADTDAVSGMEIVKALNQDPDRVFKTLVTVGKSGNHYVFMIPAARELNLKKAAECVREKSVRMIKSRDLLPVTGYIHGGCSPIGMKRKFPTAIHETAARFDTVFFSAGKIGYQVEMSLNDLRKVMEIRLADLI